MAEIVLKRPFGDAENVYIREIKLHEYGKQQTSDSSCCQNRKRADKHSSKTYG